MRRIRSHLSYANVISTLCLFLLLTGGAAVALEGQNNVYTDDIANDTKPASGGNPAGGLQAADLRPNSVGSSEVINESIAGADVKNQSGVDTCTHGSARLGELCVSVLEGGNEWGGAQEECTDLGLRLPSFGEALALAKGHDIPNVSDTEPFWAEERLNTGSSEVAYTVSDDGDSATTVVSGFPRRIVCVTTPTN
jgi:hypothetical protein